MNLLAEYRERHNLKAVSAVNEGACFFDVHRKPVAILLLSSPSRSLTCCGECLGYEPRIVAELAVHSRQLHPRSAWYLARHEHIAPDTDLRRWVNDSLPNVKGICEPYVTPDDRHLECWLWRFFVRNNPIFVRRWVHKEEPEQSIEQMIWTIENGNTIQSQPRLFETFYRNLYCHFILGRRYLLYC